LVLRTELAELERLAIWIQNLAQPAALPPDMLFALQLCAEEAVANIIMYGGAQDARQEIAVEVVHNAREVVVIIEDSGPQFDPTQVPPPSKPASLDEAWIGKLGVHLIRSFATDMSYELREGRNQLTLRFIQPETASKKSTCSVTGPDAFVFGPFRLLIARRELQAHGVPVALGQRAFEILLTLVSRHGQLVTKNELMAEVWPGVVVEENNLQVHISALRKLLGGASLGERHLLTVAGRGYRFVAPVEREYARPVAACAATTSKEPAPAAAASATRPTWNNLPQQLSPLIGRQTDLSEVKLRLQQHRLVTLVGAGGIGKTRLAIEAASNLIENYSDGVALAELAPLHDPQLVMLVLADILALRLGRDEAALSELAAALKNRHCLLILDNCEHLIAEVARVADVLMRRCPHLSILASSRERLAIAGESVFRLPSLSTPEIGTPLTAATALECSAVRLFVDWASALGDGFVLTDENASIVASICRRLDGIPLAIELAVPRLKVLSLQ
jgi:DNA-binding winged helix-turn-helix (wHTH) protein/anti-sigma regulatory factor (Ser/Thr protein kinase)